MSLPILFTKLFIPAPRPTLVARPHLITRMNAGLVGRLTLVSASAGSGKTTLVSQWLAQTDRPTTWLSLDPGESNPARFLAYLLAALQRIEADFGAELLALLETPQPPPLEALLTPLLNAIANLPQESILVLDDYHAVDSLPVDNALAFLIEHLPPQLHLVITTREDPQLPLSRLRARGQVNEIRAAELRFAPDEAAAFLNRMMGLALSPEEVAALESRTEGWAAGLQLAALSLQGREGQTEFVQTFAGDNRYIVDYLVEEVLERQPPPVRAFLLRTAILSRLTGSLCDALTGQGGGAALLESLERANLFLIPLDDSRGWYRYHHLFADVLRAHLSREEPDRLPELHRRASHWCWENNLPGEAISHALEAPDFAEAARLLEVVWPEMEQSRQSAAWLEWAQRVPPALVEQRPVLCAACGWALLDRGELEGAVVWLDRAEGWLETTAGGATVADDEQFQQLPASIASARAYCALAFGDVSGTIRHARQALALLPPKAHLQRGTPAALSGLAFWAGGQLADADSALTEAQTSFAKAGNLLYAITGVYVLADVRKARGRRREAGAAYARALQMAQSGAASALWVTADIYTGLADLCCEENNLAQAAAYLQRSQELGTQANLPRWRFRWSMAQARLVAAQGDFSAALDLLEEAALCYVRGPVPDARPITAQKARIRLLQGRLVEARQWAEVEGLTPDDELTFLQEYAHITLARLLLAEYERNGADDAIQSGRKFLERLLPAAEAGDRAASVVEICLLLALAHAAAGDMDAGLPHLQRALSLAEAEGYVRLFVEEGPPMARLLTEAARRAIAPDYTARLLADFAPHSPSPATQADAPSPLIEPLSDREQEVLELIAEGLSNQEICDRLYLALSTVKGHNRNIFDKLQVQRRTEAVARARELGLIGK